MLLKKDLSYAKYFLHLPLYGITMEALAGFLSLNQTEIGSAH